MPELPEVETTLRGIEPHITQQEVAKVYTRTEKLRWPVPKRLNGTIKGKKVLGVQRRGKYLLLNFINGCLLVHLGMTGSFKVLKNASKPNKHDHIDILFSNGRCLRYTDPRKFGAFIWTTENPFQHDLLNKLGPEPLSDEFNAEYLFNTCFKRTASIKTHIMNQKIVVGVGNIYASESLFKAGIHPERAASRISYARLEKFVKEIKKTLRAAIKKGGTTLQDFTSPDGSQGYFSIKLQVYGKGGQPCPKCSRIIKARVIGQRNSFYCPGCQK